MAAADARTSEVLRQTSVALQASAVTVWEVSPQAELLPVATSHASPAHHDTKLDLDATLNRWGQTILQGSRWIGCRLPGGGRWCVAPVRTEPPAPPPGGLERRSRERMTLEVAGLAVGLLARSEPQRPRLAEPDALAELARQPSVIAHEVANPLTAALVSLELYVQRVRSVDGVDSSLRATLLEELGDVTAGLERALEFLRSIQDRARGALGRSERFDAAQVVRSCVTLERPLARKRGVALEAVIATPVVFLLGDPNALYQILTNLIRNAVLASEGRASPVVVDLDRAGDRLRMVVRDQGVGIAAEHRARIFEPGFTTRTFGSGSGTGLAVVRRLAEAMFGGHVEVESTIGRGSTFAVILPIPPQRAPRDA
ncbi:MAG TPA: HAMP domain-containing sensor histidine kinase [Gemmatimonadales bacterium]|nr:HAMP domain-containing sensor histidine kinase [Gemmatimonadales bacterium]